MAETQPTTPVTPAASPFTTGSGAAAATHAAAAEKTRAAFAAAQPAAPATPAAPAVAPAPGIQTEGANLADLTRLSADKRRLEGEIAARDARIKELEPSATDAKLLTEVRDLYKAGKRMEAIGKLAGADPTGEMEALLADYLKPDAPAEVGDKLAAKVEEVAKRIDEGAAAKAKEQETAAQAAEQSKQAVGVVVAAIKAKAAALPHLSKEDADKAAGRVMSAFTALRYERGHGDPASLTPEITQSLLTEALENTEIEFEVRAVRAGRTANTGQQAENASPAPASLEALDKPGLPVPQAWGKTLTHKAAAEKLAAALRAGK